MANDPFLAKLMMGQYQPQPAQRGVGDVLSGLMMSDQVYQSGGAPQVSQEEYEAIMEKVRKGTPRTDAETQRLQQFNMNRQRGGNWNSPAARPAGPSAAPIPTHKQEGGFPRAIIDPFSLIADAMKQR